VDYALDVETPISFCTRDFYSHDDLLAGRETPEGNGPTIPQLANRFWTSKKRLVDSGDLPPRTLYDSKSMYARVLEELGQPGCVVTLRPSDSQEATSKAGDNVLQIREGQEYVGLGLP
jgi:hypothetical protein